MVYSISRGLQIFRLLPRPGITMHWRRKKRVYFGGLEMGLERQFESKSSMTSTTRALTTELPRYENLEHC